MSAFEKGKVWAENYLWGGIFLGGAICILVTAVLHGGLGAPEGFSLVLGFIAWAGVIAMAHRMHKEGIQESLARKPKEKVSSDNLQEG